MADSASQNASPAPPPADDDQLVLKINGVAWSGWTETRVTRGIERCPNDFDVALTDIAPGSADQLIVHAGDPCQVLLGKDPVITGFVDKFSVSIGPDKHEIRITGRGKCQDLVDDSAEWPGGQISGATALAIAQKLAEPYGITVTAPDGPGPVIPQFNLMLGETAYDIIERVCRFAQLLCYEGADGNLILAQAGNVAAASGATEGVNVLAATFAVAMNERYSEIDCFLQSMDVLADVGGGGNLIATAKDPNVLRHRKKFIIADGGGMGLQLAQPRADWEVARRAGRGNVLDVTLDSWRDSAGTLWTPNTLIPLKLPTCKVAEGKQCIGEVSYLRDEKGSRAELHVMNKAAFLPEPVLLQPVFADLTSPPPPAKP